MNSVLIKLDGVSAGYDGTIVLRHADLTVNDRDFIGVIGPNGGGKTTLVKLLLGQISPATGTVKRSERLERIGYLPQADSTDRAFPIPVKEVVLSGLQSTKGIFGHYGKEDRLKAAEIMARCGISHLADKLAGELSGGQLQRAFLCRALVSAPQLLILDEPNTYVDSKFASELYELLRELNESMAIIVVSHDVGTIASYVKSIACVNGCLHYHNSNIISQEDLDRYECPILLVTHGDVPHTVLETHKHTEHCRCGQE